MNRMKTQECKANDSRSSERGAAFVELAIVSTILVMLTLSAFEVGMAWKDSQTVSQAARTGARLAVQGGDSADVDAEAIAAIGSHLGPLVDRVQRVVIYKATEADGSMPEECVSAGAPGIPNKCSVYLNGAFTSFSQGSWVASTRSSDTLGADNLGVFVEVRREMLSGFMGGEVFDLSDTAVMRIEPGWETTTP